MEKIWLKSYQEGVRAEIDPNQYPSLNEFADECMLKHSSKVAYSNMGKEITYKQLDDASKAFANYLVHDLKLLKGDRVAIMSPNLLQYPIAMYGIHRAGMIVVNLNPLYTATELEHVLSDSETQAIVVLENFASILEKALPKTKVKHIITFKIGDMIGGLKGQIINLVVKYVKKMVPKFKLPTAVSFKKALSLGAKHPYSKVSLTHDDVAFLQYTGGTTGVAKGTILTHRNMVANVLQALEWIRPFTSHKLTGGIITALPLYHIFSLTANCITFLAIGVPNILITNPRDIPGFVKELKRQPFQFMTGVNTLYNALLRNEEFCKLDFSQFNFALGGGMAVQKAVAARWKKVTGIHLLEGYGLTETSPLVTLNPVNQTEFSGSIGLPVSSTDVVLKDENNQEVALGERGELCVKGPQVMRGYWHDEEKTKEAFTEDGWLRTGDVATMDENGFIRIVDRIKDMISISGFKVYPNEVEDVISQVEGVVEVAVIGVPDEESGERVRAYVVVTNKKVTTEKLIIDACREHLTKYKVPKEVVFKDQLPKTNVGKVLRRNLRENAEPLS